jgi:FAD/FMN-containing dehydrogenase
MSDNVVTNWFGDLVSHPQVVIDVHSKEDIIAALQNPANPSPVRAVGSNHSTSECGQAEGGTLLRMKMNRILEIGAASVTVEAGAIYIDIAKELEKHGLQFYVNTEIGSLSAGSAACAGTKDSSFEGEFGQVGSYVTRVKMVLPSGDLLDVGEEQPELLKKVRSSYGLFGIVYEVTFRVRPIQPMAVHHKTFHIGEFLAQLDELKRLGYAMMYYLFPFEDLVTVEFRKYNPGASGEPNRHSWALRNYLWANSGPRFAHDTEQNISDPKIRYGMIDGFCAVWRWKLEHVVSSDYTIAADQIIRYPPTSDDSRYTFSLFAFSEDQFPSALNAYCQFCKDYFRDHGYRTNILSVGYRIAADGNAFLSYSTGGNVMTIDPVSTANPGWKEFLAAYNQFCSERGGMPLFNQTWGITRAIAQKAYGDRLRIFAETRRTYDPGNRLLNDYFRDLLGP